MAIVIVVINPWLRTQTWDLQHRGQRSVSRMLDLVLDESLPLLLPLPQLDVDGVHNEALPLELDAISPYQIMKLEHFGTDWKPFACDAKSAHTCRGGVISSYSCLLPIIPEFMLDVRMSLFLQLCWHNKRKPTLDRQMDKNDCFAHAHAG